MSTGDTVQQRATGKVGVIYMERPAATLTIGATGQTFDIPKKFMVQFGKMQYSNWLYETELVLIEKKAES